MYRAVNAVIRYFDLQSASRGENFDYIQAWRSRPNVPWLSSWFPQNRERAQEIREGKRRVGFFDPWF